MSQIIISNNQISVQFIQYVAGETDIIIRRGGFLYSDVVDSKDAKDRCQRYLANGFKVISINGVAVKDGKIMNTEKKVASPKKPFTKESRKAWSIEHKRYIDSRLPEIRQYFKDSKVYAEKRAELEKDAKDYMKQWEASQV